jgi:ATP-dependent Lon protease
MRYALEHEPSVEEILQHLDLESAVVDSVQADKKRSRSKSSEPREVYIFPLTRRPFFPGIAAPIVIEPGPFYDALKEIAHSEHKYIGLLLTKDENTDPHKVTFDQLHTIGVLARVLRILPLDNGGAQVILNLEKRFSVRRPIDNPVQLRARIALHTDPVNVHDEIIKAYAISLITTIKDLLKLNPLFKEELQLFLGHSDFTEPGKLADFAVILTTASREELQDILSTLNVQKRLEKALLLLKKEHDLSLLQHSISQKIESNLSKTQKDFFLREQLKTLKKELGIEKEEKTVEREKFAERLKERQVPPDVMAVIQEEMDKLSVLETHGAEYSIVRNYLDWLTVIPWGILTPETHDLQHAEAILEEDHYGLEDIKQRILEFISIGKLTGGVKGNIICLVGPPGVGKTSIGKSIARALNRQFYRFSVGGMRDEAEIKGHRRTYIGAMPGKLLQALKQCKTMNPVIMLDEVDKIGNSYHGDPASALLEVLDPEQNSEFLDHYLDVRCDLSNVLFIVTANVLDTIPAPLRDRMDILRLSGYIQEEKLAIAQKYLIPRHSQLMGIDPKKVTFNKDTIRAMINGYAREAGVRTLEKQIKKVLRKVALSIVRADATKPKRQRITVDTLPDFLGKPIHTSERFYDQPPVGVCTGLAWTALGGAIFFIETFKVSSPKTNMQLTGQAGAVMKESAEIAWSYLHSALNRYAPTHTFFEKSSVHIHVPEGAVPKDGPSAGITMVTAMLSLLTDTPVKTNIAMTGELTLTGRVLAIGGVKEKLVAARRANLKTIIFPQDNRRDYDELPSYLKTGLTVHFVNHYDEVYKIAFSQN